VGAGGADVSKKRGEPAWPSSRNANNDQLGDEFEAHYVEYIGFWVKNSRDLDLLTFVDFGLFLVVDLV